MFHVTLYLSTGGEVEEQKRLLVKTVSQTIKLYLATFFLTIVKEN